MLRLNRRNLGVTIGAAILLGLTGFSMNLFGNNLGVYDEFRVSGHLNNPHQIPDRLNPRMISANERGKLFSRRVLYWFYTGTPWHGI
jgi:hypothetical protein